MSDRSLLTLNALSANIGGRRVLSDVSLQMNAGECVAVVGGSGAGKSCLLRCLMGLYKPARPVAGEMDFDGQRIAFDQTQHRNALKGGIAYVPQNPQAGLDPLKRLRSQWQQALRCSERSTMSEAAQSALWQSLGLKDFGESFPLHWSQGMQQRLLIAFALLAKPKLLVLDEPTSALDPVIAAKTITTIMAHAREHSVGVLIVTHDLALARRFAQRIAIMSAGRLLEFGPTQDLMAQPQSDFGQLLVANHSWAKHRSAQEASIPC